MTIARLVDIDLCSSQIISIKCIGWVLKDLEKDSVIISIQKYDFFVSVD